MKMPYPPLGSWALEASFLHLAMNGEASLCSPRTRSFLALKGDMGSIATGELDGWKLAQTIR